MASLFAAQLAVIQSFAKSLLRQMQTNRAALSLERIQVVSRSLIRRGVVATQVIEIEGANRAIVSARCSQSRTKNFLLLKTAATC